MGGEHVLGAYKVSGVITDETVRFTQLYLGLRVADAGQLVAATTREVERVAIKAVSNFVKATVAEKDELFSTVPLKRFVVFVFALGGASGTCNEQREHGGEAGKSGHAVSLRFGRVTPDQRRYWAGSGNSSFSA